MNTVNAEYKVTVGDYRMASYYALFLRHRKPLLIMFIVIFAALLYALGAYLGLGQANPLVFLLAGAYALWGILLFAGTERSILRYVKSEGNLLGLECRAVFEKDRVRIRIPEKKTDFICPTHKLACIFELNALFLLYADTQEVFIVPKRAFKKDEITQLRSAFRSCLKDRFSTRFEKKA